MRRFVSPQCQYRSLLETAQAHRSLGPSSLLPGGLPGFDIGCLCQFARSQPSPCALLVGEDLSVLERPLLAILSSRTGRIVAWDDPWLHRLRRALRIAESADATILVAPGTTTSKWLLAAREILASELHPLDIRPIHKGSLQKSTLRALIRRYAPPTDGTLVLLPSVENNPVSPADSILACLADRILVLHARTGGNISRICHDPASARRCERVCPPAQQTPHSPAHAAPAPHVSPTDSVASVHQLDWGDYLFHWTRTQYNGWPDDPGDAIYVKLLLGVENYDAFSALRRIAIHGVIYGTGTSSFRRVSLTAVPPPEWPGLRTFRSHRGRYDFELYGVAVHRSEALLQGAFPVSYCNPFPLLPTVPVFRGLFQPACSPTNPRLRWDHEKEWRVPGDLVLSCAPPGAVLFIAKTEREAQELSRLAGRTCAYFFRS